MWPLTRPQGLDRLVQSHETGAAGDVDCHRRPAPVEQVRYTVGYYASMYSGGMVGRDGVRVPQKHVVILLLQSVIQSQVGTSPLC